jgi:hypothetical protein
MNRQVRELLQAADPATGYQVGPGDVEALIRVAERDITGYDDLVPRYRRPSRPIAVAAAFAAAVVVLVAVLALRSAPATPAVPPRPAISEGADGNQCLAQIAAGLRATSYDGQSGRYEYLHTTLASGESTEIPGTWRAMATVMYTVDRSRWLAADGSGRLRTTPGSPSFPDTASLNFYAAHPEMLPKAGTTETQDFSPGEVQFTTMPAADPAAMGRALSQPQNNGPSQAFADVADLNSERVLDAAHRAAELRFLAGLDTVTCRGRQTDPAGRTGVLVSADVGRGPRPSPGDQGREYLLVDPGTGEILASGEGNATGPLTWSTVYLQRGYTDTLG